MPKIFRGYFYLPHPVYTALVVLVFIQCFLSNMLCVVMLRLLLTYVHLSGGMLAWLSVLGEVQICIWLSWCHCHSLTLASVNTDWFLRATAYMLERVYAMAIPSVRPSVCLSVCPSVTRVDQSKTVEARITQFLPYSSPIPLVFRG